MENTILRKPFPHAEVEICPECGQERISTCRCMEAHSECANGHKWHVQTYTKKEIKEDGRLHVVETGYIIVSG